MCQRSVMHTPSLRCYLEATAIFHSRAMSEVRVPTISDKPPCKSSSPPFLHKRALPQSKSRFISVNDVRPPRQTCSIKSTSDIPRSARSELRLSTKTTLCRPPNLITSHHIPHFHFHCKSLPIVYKALFFPAISRVAVILFMHYIDWP